MGASENWTHGACRAVLEGDVLRFTMRGSLGGPEGAWAAEVNAEVGAKRRYFNILDLEHVESVDAAFRKQMGTVAAAPLRVLIFLKAPRIARMAGKVIAVALLLSSQDVPPELYASSEAEIEPWIAAQRAKG